MRHALTLGLMLLLGCGGSQAQKAPDEAATGDSTATTDEPAVQAEEKLGSLPKEEIRAVVRDNMRDVQACYDSELELSPGLAGRVVVHFKIGPDGRVVLAEVSESTLANRAVERCIVQDVLGWEFAEPENDGVVIVNYPFNFKAP